MQAVTMRGGHNLSMENSVMSNRKEFEKAFPLPKGIEFNEAFESYQASVYGEPSVSKYNARWEAWQAARAQGDSEPVGTVNKASGGIYEFYPGSPLAKMGKGLHKVYAHQPAGKVPEGQFMVPREFLIEYRELVAASDFKEIHKLVRKLGIDALLSAQPDAGSNQWIACSERLPPHNECIDGWAFISAGYHQGDAERIPDVFYNRETGQWWHWDEGCIEEQITQGMRFTHWMKRPAPPEQESE